MARVQGIDQVNRNLRNFPRGMLQTVKDVIRMNSIDMQRYIKMERLTGGTTDTQLKVRSGALRGSVGIIKIVEGQDVVEGGVNIGTSYGRVHFGPRGRITTIRAKNAQYLTIPLPAALKGRSIGPGAGKEGPTLPAQGSGKGAARTGPWGETFVAKSKAGNLIIFGRLAYQKGTKQGQLKGGIVPLFILKKQVTVKTRIDPKEILDRSTPKIIRDLREKGMRIRG